MPTLWVFWFWQFMEFFTPYIIEHFNVHIYDKWGKSERIKKIGATPATFDETTKCDFIILWYPASYITDLVKQIAPNLKPWAVIFDICSVKAPAVQAMLEYIPEWIHLIATHPIFWPQSGKYGIKWLKMVLSNIRCDESIYQNIKDFFWNTLELKVFEMSPEEHDREMAYIMGISHFIWRALKNISIPNAPLSTKTYDHMREMSEIVGYDSLELFLSIQTDNPYCKEVRKKLTDEFQNLEKLIEEREKSES